MARPDGACTGMHVLVKMMNDPKKAPRGTGHAWQSAQVAGLGGAKF